MVTQHELLMNPEAAPRPTWTFLTNHAHVLITITADPEITLREVASRVGVTERATQSIVADLAAAAVSWVGVLQPLSSAWGSGLADDEHRGR